MPADVVIREAGLRDGLLRIATLVSTERRRAWIREAMGHPTGMALDALLALRALVTGWIAGAPTHGALWRTGLPQTFAPALAAALAARLAA